MLHDLYSALSSLQILSIGLNPIDTFSSSWMRTLNLSGLNLRDCKLNEVPKPISNMSSKFCLLKKFQKRVCLFLSAKQLV